MKGSITKLIFLVLGCATLITCGGLNQNFYEDSFQGSQTDTGACYDKYVHYDNELIETGEYAIYFGNDENVQFIERDLITQEASTKWEKKKADRNCLSSNPDDCLVWCQVIVPQQEEKIRILLDTSQTEEYEWERIVASDLVSQEGYVRELRVLCPENIDENKVERIQHALRVKGYDPGKSSNVLTRKTVKSLEEFQEENDLPVGLLDGETFDVLGLSDIFNSHG